MSKTSQTLVTDSFKKLGTKSPEEEEKPQKYQEKELNLTELEDKAKRIEFEPSLALKANEASTAEDEASSASNKQLQVRKEKKEEKTGEVGKALEPEEEEEVEYSLKPGSTTRLKKSEWLKRIKILSFKEEIAKAKKDGTFVLREIQKDPEVGDKESGVAGKKPDPKHEEGTLEAEGIGRMEILNGLSKAEEEALKEKLNEWLKCQYKEVKENAGDKEQEEWEAAEKMLDRLEGWKKGRTVVEESITVLKSNLDKLCSDIEDKNEALLEMEKHKMRMEERKEGILKRFEEIEDLELELVISGKEKARERKTLEAELDGLEGKKENLDTNRSKVLREKTKQELEELTVRRKIAEEIRNLAEIKGSINIIKIILERTQAEAALADFKKQKDNKKTLTKLEERINLESNLREKQIEEVVHKMTEMQNCLIELNTRVNSLETLTAELRNRVNILDEERESRRIERLDIKDKIVELGIIRDRCERIQKQIFEGKILREDLVGSGMDDQYKEFERNEEVYDEQMFSLHDKYRKNRQRDDLDKAEIARLERTIIESMDQMEKLNLEIEETIESKNRMVEKEKERRMEVKKEEPKKDELKKPPPNFVRENLELEVNLGESVGGPRSFRTYNNFDTLDPDESSKWKGQLKFEGQQMEKGMEVRSKWGSVNMAQQRREEPMPETIWVDENSICNYDSEKRWFQIDDRRFKWEKKAKTRIKIDPNKTEVEVGDWDTMVAILDGICYENNNKRKSLLGEKRERINNNEKPFEKPFKVTLVEEEYEEKKKKKKPDKEEIWVDFEKINDEIQNCKKLDSRRRRYAQWICFNCKGDHKTNNCNRCCNICNNINCRFFACGEFRRFENIVREKASQKEELVKENVVWIQIIKGVNGMSGWNESKRDSVRMLAEYFLKKWSEENRVEIDFPLMIDEIGNKISETKNTTEKKKH